MAILEVSEIKPGMKVIFCGMVLFLRKINYGRSGYDDTYFFSTHNPLEQWYNKSDVVELKVVRGTDVRLEVLP